MFGKIRPQILVAIICGTVFGVVGMWIGMEMGATEVVTDSLEEFPSRS